MKLMAEADHAEHVSGRGLACAAGTCCSYVGHLACAASAQLTSWTHLHIGCAGRPGSLADEFSHLLLFTGGKEACLGLNTRRQCRATALAETGELSLGAGCSLMQAARPDTSSAQSYLRCFTVLWERHPS